MKASHTLIKPFLDGILQDIREIYPDEDFSYEQDWIDNLDESKDRLIVNSLSRIGKALERSLITGQNLLIRDNEVQVLHIGAKYPQFLSVLWRQIFFCSGLPHYRSHLYESCQMDVVQDSDENVTWSITATTPEQNSFACAVYCLRQFYLACSKLSTLECLCSLRRGDYEIFREGPEKLESSILGYFRLIGCSKESRVIYIFRRRRNPSYTSSIR